MSTTAASGLLAIVVCAMLQGNPLQVQLQVAADQACILHAGATVACMAWPVGLPRVEYRAGPG